MSVTARLNLVICLTVAVGIFAFTIADESWGLLLLGMAGAFVGYIAGRPNPLAPEKRPWALPRVAVNLLVFLAIVNAALQASVFRDGQRPLVSTLGAFLVHVQLIKLVDRRTARDEAQLLGLSLFGVIASILTSNSLPLGVALTAYMPLIVASAMLTEINSASTTGVAHAPISPRSLFSQLRRVVGASVLVACALAAGVFVLTPRGIGNDLLGALGKPLAPEVGFSDNARLGNSGFLSVSQTPVMDLSLFDSDGRNAGDGTRAVYLRGAVRDLYLRRGQWMSSAEASPVEFRIQAGQREEVGPLMPEAGLLFQRITPRATGRDGDDYLFCAWRPVWVEPSVPMALRVSEADLTLRRSRNAGRTSGRGTYTVASSPADLTPPPERGGSEPVVSNTFNGTRVAELARTILAGSESGAGGGAGGAGGGATEREALAESAARRRDAMRIRDYLQSECAYTLEMIAPAEGQDPIEMFLFDTKRGHCEYFASAMVALCQSAGIPARLVLGYVATDYSPFTEQYTVRESNAHAWVEVCIGQGRWITLDPSPPADIERIHRPPGGLLSRLRSIYDLIEFNWNESIVGFDSGRQRRMLGSTRGDLGWLGNASAQAQEVWLKVWRKLGVPDDMSLGADFFRVITWWVALAVLILLFVWLAWRKRRTVLFRRLAHGDLDPELRSLLAQSGFYRGALRGLRRAGLEKPRSRGAGAHADAVAAARPEVGEAFGRIARHYYTLRFARRRLSDAEVADAWEAMRRIRAANSRVAAPHPPGGGRPADHA